MTVTENFNRALWETAQKYPELGIQRLFSRTPNICYYQYKNKAYVWTTERTGDGKFEGVVYRILKNGNWKLSKKCGFAKRWKAKDWTYKQYCKAKNIEFRSLHCV